jgi:uncharacterized Zn finger protein (UPF0148 family)
MEARHCGACGQGLFTSLKQGEVVSHNATAIKARQYTPSEIEELLITRKAIKAAEESARILNQNDIDNLFQ